MRTIQARINKLRTEENKAMTRIASGRKTIEFFSKVNREKH